MDQVKIGEFLRELRKEKDLTQEMLADKLNVSRRTVSRWETGSNMPDLDILVELADFYDVDLRDIFNGQRREEKMDNELKDTLLQAADYTHEQANRSKKRINLMFLAGIIALIAYTIVIVVMDEQDTFMWGMLRGVMYGVTLGLLTIGFIITSPFAEKFQKICEAKRKLLKKE